MALINTSLPNLIQGVSQQPDALRYDGQCEEQENALSSVVDGLTKRPNTRHVARLLQAAIAANSFVHFINRDKNERYVVIHDGTSIQAWNLDGTQATINGLSSYTTTGTYFDAQSPKSVMKALTIADGTFILNAETAVAADSALSPSLDQEALVFVKQGDYKKEYALNVTGTFGGGLAGSVGQATVVLSPYTGNFMEVTSVVPLSGILAGTGYNAGSGVTFTIPATHGVDSSYTLTTQREASYSVTVDENGALDTVTVIDGGQYLYSRTSPSLGYLNSQFQNDVTASDPPALQGGNVTVNVSIRSGSSTGTDAAQNADTNIILKALHDRFVSSYKFPQNPSDGSDPEFNVTYSNNLMVINRPSNMSDFSISATDGLGGTALGVIYKEVDSIADLPVYAKNGFEVKVRGDIELNQDDYYVKFETALGEEIGAGSWVETLAPEVTLGLDDSTMPHVLTNTAENVFTLDAMNIAPRLVGDDNTNPLPSFTNNRLRNLFFFKNRLGFVSNENIIMSENGFGGLDDSDNLQYNFSRTTVTTLLDSDPIDVAVAGNRVTNLRSAKGFQENLIVCSDNGQFVLKGGDILTPKTVSINAVTNFDVDDSVDPIPLGAYLYFPFSRSGFTGVREYAVNATTDVYDSVEVTEHVPRYVPSNLADFAGSNNENILALVSSDEPSSIYIYKYFFSGNQKVLSSWFKFTIDGEIRGIEFIDSTLQLVVVNDSETCLVEMPLEAGIKDDAGYNTYLDQRVEDTVLSGNSTITLPYTPADDSVQVYTKDGLKLSATNVGSTVTLAQPVSEDTDVWVGYPYTMKYTFSEQLFKASTGNSKSPSAASKLMVRNGALFFDDTAYFQVKVTPKARQTYVNTFTPDVVGSTTIGELNLDSGFYRFPVFTKAADTTITIENDSALPSNFQSAEFESFVHSRSNRYG